MNNQLNEGKKNFNDRYFNNPLLEKMAYTSAFTVNLIFIPLVLFFAYLSFQRHSIMMICLGFMAGLFLWSFVEYMMHRFAFHFKFKNEKLKWFHAILHLSHHQSVHDKRKYQTLLLLSLPTAIVGYFLLKLFLGSYVEPVFTGFICGYVFYEFTHYSTHKMDLVVMRSIKQHHMYHHFLNQEKNFGVTSAFWDIIFGTRLTERDKIKLLQKKAELSGD